MPRTCNLVAPGIDYTIGSGYERECNRQGRIFPEHTAIRRRFKFEVDPGIWTAIHNSAWTESAPITFPLVFRELRRHAVRSRASESVASRFPQPHSPLFPRGDGGEDGKTPNGVLEETAFMIAAVKVLPKMGDAELDSIGLADQRLYAANGHTFAQEGRSNVVLDQTWMRLAQANRLIIDLVSHPDLTFSDAPFGVGGEWHSRKLSNGCRIGGVKLSFDGSPQGKTASLSQPYFIPPRGQPSSYLGYATIPAGEVNRKIALCYLKGWQFIVHCDGDAAGQCIPVDAALKSLTLWPAYQHYEEASRGSITEGKLADFVVLDRNPHKTPILELADLRVKETIKAGQTIHRAK